MWVAHLEEHGFTIEDEVITGDVINAKRTLHNIKPELTGCHLADIDGYLIEGHVPASDIARMVDEKHDIAGLSVPGMPAGSPGMSGTGPFQVFSFNEEGMVTGTFARH